MRAIGYRLGWIVCLVVLIVSEVQAADIELGEYLSSQCTTCHQLSGKDNGIPSIVGWQVDHFVQAMRMYKSKERTNPVMNNIASSLEDSDFAALAAYFGRLAPQQ